MKQFTFSAVMANSIKNLLQGYTKSIRFVAFLLVLFTVNIGTASAEKSIDFESGTATYSDWTFTNMTSKQSGSITAKGGSYYGTTGAKSTASIQTKNQISSPKSISCYVSKQTTNTTSSTWYIQTSTNGSSWTNVKTQSATSMSKGSWVEFTADLSSYSNVYVRIYYSGSTVVRNIDNLVLTEGTTTSYDVNWKVNGEVYETTQVTEGSKPTFPATPSSCDATSNTFYGWATATWDGKIDDINGKTIYTSANEMPEVNGAVTYYAVFATATGGGDTSKQYSFDITPSNFNTTSYAANNNEKTSTAKASDGSTLSVKWTSNQVMLQSGDMQWQKSAGYIYNSTDLGTINSVNVTSSAGTFTTYYGTSKQPSSGTTVGNGYFQIKVGSATGKTSKVTITFTKTTSGAQTTTYSDYTTTCGPSCTAPTSVKISGDYVHFPGETLILTVSGDNIANNATYTWKKGGQVIAGQTTATLTINEATIENAGNYTCTVSNGDGCEATADYTVKMYSLRGLTDNNWSTDFVFTKVNATTATYSMELAGNSSYYFKVYDGSAYYGNTGGNPTMTSDNCTNWTMQQNTGNNVTLQTTAAGIYTFTLDYTDASNPTISVTYPAKRIVYLEPGVWYTGENQEKFVVHAWYSSTVQDILMTKIDDCAGRNIYQAEIDANHEQVIFIRVDPAGLDLSNPWSNEWNRTKDLTLISENQFTITTWDGTGEWNNSTEKSNGEWTTFTPNYTVTFDANGHGTAPADQCIADGGKVTTPTAPTATGYTFGGWYKEAGCTNAWDFAADVVTADITLYAKWTVNTHTLTWDVNGGNALTGTYTKGEVAYGTKIVAPATPTRTGHTFLGWKETDGSTTIAETMPDKNLTYTAQWTETNYALTHNGSNYTNTENKTTIKSSETPLTLNYTCTGDYGFPSTITISDGGKSWTAGTDYVWTVAADKQSATLTINQTTISANVTITINMATRYTVTFIHNDKGVFSGSETLEVLSSENTITLPTVTDVSCGFYDTFEGWIVSNDEYVESTTKPATVYAGGASYRVTGDCTFRALYSKCEGDATQVYRKVTSTGEVTDGTYILVANTSTPRVYSGYGGATYGSSVEGLIADGEDFSTTLSESAKPITVTVGTGTDAGTFAMYNADRSKYLTYSGSSNTLNESDTKVFIWKLTDGSSVNSKSCPAGVLTPNGFNTRVLQCNTASSYRFACYTNTQSAHVFLYKLIDKCTKYYSTNPSCEKPVGVHIVYNANAVDANMSCNTQDRTYKVENEVNKYPQLASQLQFCTNATREGYTLVGWNTQANGQGTTYNINQNYYRLPVSGDLDGDNWITLNLYAVWKQSVKFDLGNATGGAGVPDAVVENGECVLPEPTAEQLGTIPCAYEFYAWSETSVNATQSKPTVWMPGDTYTGSATTLYAVYRYAEGMGGSDTYYFTFNKSGKTYCITAKHNSYDRFVVAEQSTGLMFGLENGYLYYLDEGVKTFVYWEGDGTTVTTTTTYPNNATQKTTFVEGDNGTTVVTPAISGRYLQMPSSYTDRAYYTNDGINPTLVEVEAATYTYATNPTCYTTANLHFVTNGGTLNYPTSYDETNYQELTAGSTVLLPTATFAGEWTFEGWKRGAPLESTTTKPYDPSFYSVTLNTTQFEVDALGDIYFYAVYSKTVDDKQFDPVNGGTYKLFAIGEDGTKTYMPIWSGGRGTLSGVTTCAETGDYTITPGTGTHAGQYQITCGEHTLGVVGDIDQTDLKEVEGTWWNISESTSGKGTWRITVVGSRERALSCSFSVAKSFGNYAISNLNNPSQTIYRDMEIGECIYTEYTSTPENIPYITITGAPVKITSTNGERVYAPTTLHIEAHNFTGERIIHLSATNGFGVDPVQVRTNGQGVYSGNVKVYYEPTTDGDGQTITTSVLTASQTGGTNAEKISQTFAAIQGRNMPANFVIAAKWDGYWYALPANCTSSLSSTEGLLIEVDDVDNPTRATQAPASAKYGIREVIPSRQTDHGQGIVFTERFAKDDKQFALYNGSDANIQVNAQYSNYAQTKPDKYEWIPTTSDFNEYTVTNASTGRNLGLTSGSFGAYTAASNRVYLLPATFYEPAPVQVLKWKENSVIVMYTGAETTATTQVGTNAVSAAQTLENQKLTHGIYELTTDQALTSNAGGVLKLNFGADTRVELEIPLIISGNVTASANAHDVVILENSKLTAAATKYSYKDVYVYGGAKLAIPTGTAFGVNNIILRAGGVATDGAGQNATYQYIYPQVELKGTLTSSVQNIRYEYVTDYDHWYHLVLPFDGSLASIHYPYEYYGDQVKLDNKGSWIIKRYDGATRATGNYDAWKDIEEDEPEATTVTAGKGYIYWGAPKKITANDVYDRPTWGIQRITMSVSAPAAKTAENGDKTISGLSSYVNVANNSGKVNDQGWNLIGNPYMVNLTTMAEDGLKAGKLEKEIVDGNWTGKWFNNGDGIRYLTIPSEHFDTYTAKTVSAAKADNNLVPGHAFFVQLEGEADGVTFAAANRASLMPALLAENNDKPVDIETGIILSNETLQDEVNFWIKDGKTNNYEYNADYPKTPNNNRFNIYGVHTNGDLSWVATSPEYAAESMPIGYQVPAAGTFTLSVSETYYSENLQALFVTDHEASPEVTTNLVDEDYTFYVNQAETNNTRFTVSIILKPEKENTPTGVDNINTKANQPIKFLYQDKIYILRNGMIYDTTGKQVITINK